MARGAWRRWGAAALSAAALFGVGGGAAIAPAAPVAAAGAHPAALLKADQGALAGILQNDFEVQGTARAAVDGANLPAALTVALAGTQSLSVGVRVTAKTLVEVGPYAVDASFVLAGASVKVWFHVDAAGDAVADLIVVQPTVIKGTLVGLAPLDPAQPNLGQVLRVQVTDASGNVSMRSVDVLPATKVQILPPWNAAQGLGAVSQVAAVGVVAPGGALDAAMVVGIVASSD